MGKENDGTPANVEKRLARLEKTASRWKTGVWVIGGVFTVLSIFGYSQITDIEDKVWGAVEHMIETQFGSQENFIRLVVDQLTLSVTAQVEAQLATTPEDIDGLFAHYDSVFRELPYNTAMSQSSIVKGAHTFTYYNDLFAIRGVHDGMVLEPCDKPELRIIILKKISFKPRSFIKVDVGKRVSPLNLEGVKPCYRPQYFALNRHLNKVIACGPCDTGSYEIEVSLVYQELADSSCHLYSETYGISVGERP